MDDGISCLFPADRIAARVGEMGRAIRTEFDGRPLTVLGILKGSALFTADLVRALGEPTELTFIQARSYGQGTTSSGTVSLSDFEEELIRDRTVVVTDTILDTGRTLDRVQRRLAELGAERVVSCVLLDKPARRTVDVSADHVGFPVEDRFLVGYGLDHGGRYRALPYVGYLKTNG